MRTPVANLISTLVLGALVWAAVAVAQEHDPLAPARAALESGQADEAIRLLNTALVANSNDAEAHNLLCRVYFAEERFDQAANECARAVALAAQNSGYHLWLGRALGEKADRAAMLSAYGLGKKVKSEFEAAVKFDNRNADALADLGEFYYSAPSLVGGGVGKAEAVAVTLEGVDPLRALELRGNIAEHGKDYVKAEAFFKSALAASAHPAHQWSTLAAFYRRRERFDEMVQAVKSVISTDKQHSVALVNAASSLIRSKREPQLAIQMLESYLASNKKTEEAPAFAVHVRLGKLRQQTGDAVGAENEFQAALALAKDYKPAQEQATNTGR